MELLDLCSLETWAKLEDDIFERSGLNSAVYDVDGIRINSTLRFPNRLCPEIKSNPKGQSFICATAHMNLANMARQSGDAVIEECDAGLFKLVVPIIVDGTFLGAAGGCGTLLDDGEVDAFLVNKTTDIAEEQVEALSEGTPVTSSQAAEALAEFVKLRIDRIISDYQAKKENRSQG